MAVRRMSAAILFCRWTFCHPDSYLRDRRSTLRQKHISGWVLGVAWKIFQTFHPFP